MKPRRPTRRRGERTIHILVREGIVEAGTRLVLHAPHVLAGATIDDPADPKFHARVADNPTSRANIIWDIDGLLYSLSALSEKLRDDHGVPLAAGALAGY